MTPGNIWRKKLAGLRGLEEVAWNYPPSSNSHHQEIRIVVGNPHKLSLATATGGRSKK